MRKYRFHLLSLAHTKCSNKFATCAYTQKVVGMAKMMSSLGHEVYLYSAEHGPEDGELPPHTKFIPCVSKKTWDDYLGNYNTYTNFYKFDMNDPVWSEFNIKTSISVRENLATDKENFVLCFFGIAHQEAVKNLNSAFVVEPGIGYKYTFAPFRVFESSAWYHFIHGTQDKDLGTWVDTVIPNYYDLNDFEFSAKKEDYHLFVGRLIQNKGVAIAVDVARKLGKKIYLAGQAPDNLSNAGVKLDDQVQYLGVLNVKERSQWMKNATAVWTPTYYIGPFEGVSVEAQLCGTPVITSHFGVFGETVLHGKTGYRCRAYKDFLWAAQHIHELNPYDIRQWAAANYSLDRVKYMYQAYWDQLADLGKNGWYETQYNPVENLDHFNKYYPH